MRQPVPAPREWRRRWKSPANRSEESGPLYIGGHTSRDGALARTMSLAPPSSTQAKITYPCLSTRPSVRATVPAATVRIVLCTGNLAMSRICVSLRMAGEARQTKGGMVQSEEEGVMRCYAAPLCLVADVGGRVGDWSDVEGQMPALVKLPEPWRRELLAGVEVAHDRVRGAKRAGHLRQRVSRHSQEPSRGWGGRGGVQKRGASELDRDTSTPSLSNCALDTCIRNIYTCGVCEREACVKVWPKRHPGAADVEACGRGAVGELLLGPFYDWRDEGLGSAEDLVCREHLVKS